jgi:hypothetical protein
MLALVRSHVQSHTQNTNAPGSYAIRESMVDGMSVPVLFINPRSKYRQDRTTRRETLYSTKTTKLNPLMLHKNLHPV